MINLVKPARAYSPERSRRGFVAILIVAIVALMLGVGGTLAYQKYKKPAPSPIPSPIATTPEPSVSRDLPATTAWKTYTSTIEKLTFKYPVDWELRPTSGKEDPTLVNVQGPIIVDSPTEPLRHHLSLIVVPTKFKTSKDAINDSINQIKSGNPTYPEINTQTITVGDQSAELTTDLPSAHGAIQVYVVNKGKLYQFTFYPYSPSATGAKPAELKTTSEQILSTVKFLDP